MIAVPAIISNITTPLLGLVDTAITGHLGAASYIGAIALGGTMFSIIYWVMNFLRMGSSGLTAQAYGAGDMATSYSVLRTGLSIAAIASAVMILTGPLLASGILWFMDADAETTQLARQYFLIVIWGAPAVLGTFALTGWLIGMQDSRTPMWMALITNVVNICVSLTLVYGFGLKIAGIAVGTLTAQWAGFLWGFKSVPVSKIKAVKTRGLGKRFLKVNTDIFFRTMCLAAVTVWFTRAGAMLGTDILAANAILMQLFILFSYFMDGFAFSGEALAGKYFGASDIPMLKRAVKGIFLWGVAVVMLFTLVYIIGGEWIVGILTDDFHVRATASAYLWWAVAVPVAGVAAFAWDGIFIGLTLTRAMLVSMATAMIVFFACYLILTPVYGNHGLWMSFIAYLATRGLIETLLYRIPTKQNP